MFHGGDYADADRVPDLRQKLMKKIASQVFGCPQSLIVLDEASVGCYSWCRSTRVCLRSFWSLAGESRLTRWARVCVCMQR